jgi:hypothetical protein
LFWALLFSVMNNLFWFDVGLFLISKLFGVVHEYLKPDWVRFWYKKFILIMKKFLDFEFLKAVNRLEKEMEKKIWIFEDAEKEKRRGWRFYIIKGLIYFLNQLQIWCCRVNNEKSVADHLNNLILF